MATATLRTVARVIGAGTLGATAGIHLYLNYSQNYSSIHTIGPLFLLAGISGSLLCLAVLLAPARFLSLVAAAGAAFQVGILIGLALATDRANGLFGFKESSRATLYWQAVTVELIGAVVLAGLAGVALNRRSAVTVRRV
jgi:hypothetical protein